MEFRKAIELDIDDIMDIIKEAQESLKNQGVDQWQDGYPNADVIGSDIDKGYGYVLVEDTQVIGTVALVLDGEKNYEKIYEGEWLTNGKYGTIHRIAVATGRKGSNTSMKILEHAEKICMKNQIYSIKVDTHRGNVIMQKWLNKNGFSYCGIIYLEDGNERFAFEKILEGV